MQHVIWKIISQWTIQAQPTGRWKFRTVTTSEEEKTYLLIEMRYWEYRSIYKKKYHWFGPEVISHREKVEYVEWFYEDKLHYQIISDEEVQECN